MFKITFCRKANDCQSPLLEVIPPEIYFKPNNNKLFFCCIKLCLKNYLPITFGGAIRRPTEKNIADCSVGNLRAALPAFGFYPKILGFFEAVGIFLGFYFEK